MTIAIVTGSAGLIGSEAVCFFANKFSHCIGIDNDMRSFFFGESASTTWNQEKLKQNISNYIHKSIDIRNKQDLENIFNHYQQDIKLIIHTAAQPSHDWAAKNPFVDFSINATGTLNLLEMTRLYCPSACFIFTSTNKVYGDTPNRLPLTEKESRWEIDSAHPYAQHGIDENMSIDQSTHSVFGVSKTAADIMVQEYGRYFGLKTGIFRGGCLTGPNHSGAKLHGFLAYLMQCIILGKKYYIFGYKGKQVRDNIHCCDLISAFDHFYQNPKHGEVYNIGGSRFSNCSMLEAIEKCEKIADKKASIEYQENNRVGDHIWYISDVRKFKQHYPNWRYTKNIDDILQDIFKGVLLRQ